MPIRHLVQQSRVITPWLLAGIDEPHAELLTMVWSPRFDHQHALELLTRLCGEQSAQALPVLTALQSAAGLFDHLSVQEQNRLRRLILRHQRLQQARQCKNAPCITSC